MSDRGRAAALARELAHRYPLPTLGRRLIEVRLDDTPEVAVAEILADLGAHDSTLDWFCERTDTLRDQGVTSAEAIRRIGVPEVHAAALVAAIADIGGEPGTERVDWLDFWRLAVGTGVAARMALPPMSPHLLDAFTLGLCHDLGLLLLDRSNPSMLDPLLHDTDWKHRTPTEEREHLGFALHELTAHLLHQWGFPLAMVLALLEFEQPRRSSLGEVLRIGQSCARALCSAEEGLSADPSSDAILLALARFLRQYRALVDGALVGLLAPEGPVRAVPKSLR